LLIDSILGSRLRKEIIKNINLYISDLIEAYENEMNSSKKSLLLSLIAISPDSEVLLKNKMGQAADVRIKASHKYNKHIMEIQERQPNDSPYCNCNT